MKRALSFFNKPSVTITLGAVSLAAAILLETLSLDIAAIIIYLSSLVICGHWVFIDAVKGIIRRDLLDEKFLMSIASVGAFIIGEWSEGVAVMLFFLIGETFERMAVNRSRSSIKALMSIRPDTARVVVDGAEEEIDAEDVEVGTTILIKPGERVPLDSRVLIGSADIDTSAVTGESIPRSVTVGDELDSGTIVLNSALTCVTLREADDSAASRILKLVEEASENKSREESFITSFSKVYTPIVVSLAVILAILLPIFGLSTVESAIYRALMFLVISCPCALVISVPMAFFGGIGACASLGILFKGGETFTKLLKADTVAFDKTGTLTTGLFSVAEIRPVGVSNERFKLLVASAERGSNHPIAAALRELSDESVSPDSVEEYAGEGIIASVLGVEVAVGNGALMKRVGANYPDSDNGAVLVCENGKFIGEIIISDDVKPEGAVAVSALSRLGVKRFVMLTGDRRHNAESAAAKIGIGEVYSQLTPEQKYRILSSLISESNGVVYVGDGINDAPSLALADVGIAMGGIGQDSAVEAADLVIMNDDPTKIADARKIARKTLGIAKFNIVFALTVKILIMILGAFNLADMLLAVFADVGVAVIAILNSMRLILRKNNNA